MSLVHDCVAIVNDMFRTWHSIFKGIRQKLENKLFEYKHIIFERFVFESKYIIFVFWNASGKPIIRDRVTNKIRRYLSHSLKCKPRPKFRDLECRRVRSQRLRHPYAFFYFFRLFNEFVLFVSNSNPRSPQERKICFDSRRHRRIRINRSPLRRS